MPPLSIDYIQTSDKPFKLPDNFLCRKIKIAIIQLNSPFIENLQIQNDMYRWIDSELYFSKIKKILLNLKEKNPDIVVFPEYTIPNNKLNEVMELSKDFKVVIAGSDICRDQNQMALYQKNICPVIIKDKVFLVEKLWLATNENRVREGDEGASPLKLSFKIKNKIGQSIDATIKIYICLDYIAHHDTKDMSNGLNIVIMCTNNIEDFIKYAEVDVRKQKFTIFCNTFSFDSQYIGKSSIYGPNQEKVSLIDRIITPREGFILAELNISAPYVHELKSAPFEQPVGFHEVYYFDENYMPRKQTHTVYNYIHNFNLNLVKSDCQSIQFPASVYPDILLQLIKEKHLIKAVAFYNKYEKFWSGNWGKRLNEHDPNRENTRIFVVNKPMELYDLYDHVLKEHSNNYNVFVISIEVAKEKAGCDSDFAIVIEGDDMILSEYKTIIDESDEGDEYIDTNVIYSVNSEKATKKLLVFDTLIDNAVKVENDTDIFDLIEKVFPKNKFMKSSRKRRINVDKPK
jgi:hypothetical protein